MSDKISKALAQFAQRVNYQLLTEKTIEEVKRRVIDTFGCLISGYNQDASIAARKLADRYMNDKGATIIGSGKKATVDVATFTNGTAIRYLDYNDTYLSLEPLHPSDVIAPLLALADEREISTKRLIVAIAVAYEIGVIFCDEVSLKSNGWDHVNYITVATVVGGANLLGLSIEETEQALALAIVPHAAMRQTRNGEISMWKGAAAANAARNAVFALQLAECGMKGPFEPFEGTMGMNYQMLNKKLNSESVVAKLEQCKSPELITITYVKKWAVEYMTQSAIEAALLLRGQFIDMEKVEHVHVATFQMAYDVLAKDKQKWAPKTRETADHSLPYIVMAALEDGKIDLDTFSSHRLANAQTMGRLQSMITIEVTDEMNAGYPDGNPNRITITLKDGTKLQQLVKYPSGHRGNPMNNGQIEEKFERLTEGYLTKQQQKQGLKDLWNLEEQIGYTSLFKHFEMSK
jgi:2-methylcitrate dehydratase